MGIRDGDTELGHRAETHVWDCARGGSIRIGAGMWMWGVGVGGLLCERSRVSVSLLPKQERQKYTQLQEIIKKLDEEKKRGDSLLYAMIPKAVADRLRKGVTALETCQ
eukprot:g13684.t1